jgi:hypothetical protein
MTAHDVLTPYFLREVPSSEVYQTRLQDEFHLVDKFGFTAVFVQVHAVSYAQLVWALAYEKAHNPHRFWMGALNHCHSEYRKWVQYREAKCSGLQVPREPPPYKLGTRQGNLLFLQKNPKENSCGSHKCSKKKMQFNKHSMI